MTRNIYLNGMTDYEVSANAPRGRSAMGVF